MSQSELLSQANEMLAMFGSDHVPLMGFCSPRVIAISDEACCVAIPLNDKTKNHLGCMYFGALHIGADCAGGILAMHQIQQRQKNISLIFKNAEANFLRRAEGEVHFYCGNGREIAKAIDETIATGERVNVPLKIVATVPALLKDEHVVEYELTLSLKCHD